MGKMYLFDLEDTLETFRGMLAELTDPRDESEDPEKLFRNVVLGKPKTNSLFAGELAYLKFYDNSFTTYLRGRGNMINIQGAIIHVIPGLDDKAAKKCTKDADIIQAYLRSNPFKDVPGTDVTLAKVKNPQSFRTIPWGDVKKPNLSTGCGTLFDLSKVASTVIES
ncbi:MAG: hypothetical protein AMQ22_00074 [Candidatus Methanofastidiosum methylothiophilum]|uniref:Uncharacterized protein n=1 Tax=Candidatus Methanofastidiosum methylothiophilum TaxID=1705564 RepID=A0A150JAA1_9EURY|nr:MAG: hypothetical protein AMQ22_00074 [Candidatus Methanofastidiosum methylthiophilus]